MHKTATDADSLARSDELPTLEMVGQILGFPDHRHFALVRHDDDGTILELRSIEDAAVRFVVVPPALFFPAYAPEIPDDAAALLRAEPADDLLALVLVTLHEDLSDATANLVAPVVVNPRTRLAAQVVLDDTSLSLRTPLVPDHAP